MRNVKISIIGLLASLLALLAAVPVSAHVVVKPGEVQTASFQTFTMGVPNEKGIPTTSVKLTVPAGLQFVSPTQKPGWDINVEKEGEGEAATVKSITWSGSSVNAGFREDFTFSAKVSNEVAELQWKAYQTYGDGTVVAWDLAEDQQPKKADGSPDFSASGPFSVTKVVSETEQTTAIKKADQAAADAAKAASRAQTFGIAALALSFVSIALTMRNKNTDKR